MNDRDRQVVVPRPVAGTGQQLLDGFPDVILVARPDAEEQAELARGADLDPGRDVPAEGMAKIFLLSVRAWS
jgi:hypothetical protein